MTCTTTIAEIARTSTDDLGVCTMTVVEDPYLYHFPNTNVNFPQRPEKVYFLYLHQTPTIPIARFEGITTETTAVNEC